MSTFCCYPPTERKYDIDEEEDASKPLLPHQVVRSATVASEKCYPGFLRPVNSDLPPKNSALVKTGGNALQAVDASVLDQKNLVQVVVPDANVKPGDMLYVVTPDGTGRLIAARIPEGCSAGSVFFVNSENILPVVTATAVVGVDDHPDNSDFVVVDSVDVTAPPQPAEQKDLFLTEETMDEDLVEVQIPEGSRPGDSIRVELPDGRVVDAIVPEGNVQKIYVKAPASSATMLPPLV